jgi:AcrR family transcriptional regulator
VAAALDAFATRGVEATSLDSVAAAIGIRKQTILYWFPSKDALLLAVVDHAVADLGARLTGAVERSGPGRRSGIVAVVDAIFRLGSTDPELLALVREVARVGGGALAHLGDALDPLLSGAAVALAGSGADDPVRIRRVLLDVGVRVVGMATEAELRGQLGLPADLAWLRARRRALIDDLTAALAPSSTA